MRYLLDTDICSYAIRARDAGLLAILQGHASSGADLSISTVTYAELRLGAERSQNAARHHHAIQAFSSRLSDVLAWDRAAADEFASLQARLLRIGRPIGNNDAMIAAHALSLDRVAGHQQREALLPSAGIVRGELGPLIRDVRRPGRPQRTNCITRFRTEASAQPGSPPSPTPRPRTSGALLTIPVAP